MLYLFVESKDEAIETYRKYKIEVENQFDKKIVMIRRGRCGKNELVHILTSI